MRFRRVLAPSCISLLLATTLLPAQGTSPDPQQTPVPNADASVVGGPAPTPRTSAQLKDQAWSLLTDAVQDQRHSELRIQALAALGTMGATPRSVGLIHDATSDKDVDVRTASVLAASRTRSPALTTDLRQMLDDREPHVVYAAALALWQMHDRSGEDILIAVARGGRSANAGIVGSTGHSINKELHNPAAMVKDGALEGASMLLGPFGMGLTAYEYVHKNGGGSARVDAIQAVAQFRTGPIREALVADLMDKDLAVRAAALEALSAYHEPAVATAISKLLDDPKPPVRFTAAAAYLIAAGAATSSTKATFAPARTAQR